MDPARAAAGGEIPALPRLLPDYLRLCMNSVSREGDPMKKNTERFFPYGMTLPALFILLCLSLFPILYLLFYSFTDFRLLGKTHPSFIGFQNYARILRDPYFLQSLRNTVLFTVLAVLSETILGLLMALLINGVRFGAKVLRILVLLPTLLPGVTAALTWQLMLSNNYGVINKMLAALGAAPVNWLMETRTAFYAILFIDIWQFSPFAFLLLYAALQTVPESQYEAAQMDGAGSLQQFFYVTLPNIRPALLLTAMLRTIDTFRLFDKVNILTKGGPANSTATITQYIYLNGIRSLKIGYGGAASILMTVFVLALSFLYLARTFHKRKPAGF